MSSKYTAKLAKMPTLGIEMIFEIHDSPTYPPKPSIKEANSPVKEEKDDTVKEKDENAEPEI